MLAGRAAWRGSWTRGLAALPLEIGVVDIIQLMARTIPLRAGRVVQRRCRHRRTIGQLVAESIQFYEPVLGRLRSTSARRGHGPVRGVSREYQLIAPTLRCTRPSARASTLVLDSVPPRRRLRRGLAARWLVSRQSRAVPRRLVIQDLWLAPSASVPVLVVEEIPVRAALRRAWQLARADFVHALGSLFTLAVVVILSQSVIVFILRGFGDADRYTALFLAGVVLSPLLFVGTALLYVDQAARVE
jgi:hypothetical protein